MLKRFLTLGLLFVVIPMFAQEVDLTGSWVAYATKDLSTYTLKEHQAAQSSTETLGATLTLNADGTVITNLSGLSVQSWMIDEGFIMFVTQTGNSFYWPRQLQENVYFLVRVDVMELNEEIVNLSSKPQGGLIIIRQQ